MRDFHSITQKQTLKHTNNNSNRKKQKKKNSNGFYKVLFHKNRFIDEETNKLGCLL